MVPHSVFEQLVQGKLEHRGTRAQVRVTPKSPGQWTIYLFRQQGQRKSWEGEMRAWREASQLCCHKDGGRRDWEGKYRKERSIRHWDVQGGLQIAQVGFIENWLLVHAGWEEGWRQGHPSHLLTSWPPRLSPWPLLSSSLPCPSTFKNASNSEIFLGK